MFYDLSGCFALSILFNFYSNFLEAQDTSSKEDTDIFGSTQTMLLMKHEAKNFAISPSIPGNCHYIANHDKLEPNIDGDEGMLQISGYFLFLRLQNTKVYIKLPLNLWLGVRSFERKKMFSK